jgi:poly-gamma-glutamate synthase PgsB/CapB
MYFIFALFLALLAYWLLEYARHRRNVRAVPLRVLVNGTRGKSSVTRLIAAALRAGGQRTLAKTTGSTPRLIFEEGDEVPIPRMGKPNIMEQRKIMGVAARRDMEAVVLENMSLRPDLQITERQIVHPTVGIITNVRPDHLDVMGPTTGDVALALSATVPEHGAVFTSDVHYFPLIEQVAQERSSLAFLARPEEVDDEDMKGFSYVEHKDNVAIVLKLCEYLGIPRDKAVAEMHRSTPDIGVLRIFSVEDGGKSFEFVNAFAANDPDSLFHLWGMMKSRRDVSAIVMNCRSDRVDRSRQLGGLIVQFAPAFVLVTGDLTAPFIQSSIRAGFPREKLVDLGGLTVPGVYESMMSHAEGSILYFGMGNIVTFGERLSDYIGERGTQIVH